MGDATKYIYGAGSTTEWEDKVKAAANALALAEDQLAELYTLVGETPGANPSAFDTRVFFTTAGTSTAYTITSATPYESQPEGLRFRVKLHTACGDDPTLKVDSLSALPLEYRDGLTPKSGELSGYIEVWCDGTAFVVMAPTKETGLASVQVFTSSGTWTKPAGIRKVRVQLSGGGGGGAAGDATNGSGSGGAAGGYSEKLIDVSAISSESVTVGAGGAGATSTGGNGSAGGSSSFGGHLSATGGSGGNGTTTAGVAGGSGSGGDVNIDGGSSSGAFREGGTAGGSSFLGGAGGGGNADSNDGFDGAANSGSGGGGGAKVDTADGGNGADGIVIVWEYK